MKYFYDYRTGQYRGSDGRFISAALLATVVEDTGNNLRNRLTNHAEKLLTDRIGVADFQLAIARELKITHLQLGLLANPKLEGSGTAIKEELRSQFERLQSFGREIAEGNLTAAAIRARAAQYSNSIVPTYHRAAIEAKKNSGIKSGRRILDSQAKHCNDCLKYAALGWVSLEKLIVPGTNCQCSYGCRCSISYRYY